MACPRQHTELEREWSRSHIIMIDLVVISDLWENESLEVTRKRVVVALFFMAATVNPDTLNTFRAICKRAQLCSLFPNMPTF